MASELMKPGDTTVSKVGGTMVKTGSISSVMVFGAGLLPFVAMSWPLLIIFGIMVAAGVLMY